MLYGLGNLGQEFRIRLTLSGGAVLRARRVVVATGATNCGSCGAGKYDHDLTPKTSCRTCPPGWELQSVDVGVYLFDGGGSYKYRQDDIPHLLNLLKENGFPAAVATLDQMKAAWAQGHQHCHWCHAGRCPQIGQVIC